MLQKTCILVVALLGAVVVAQTQPPRQGHRLGVLLYDGAPPGLLEAFREGLHALGYVDGHNITLELRNAQGRKDQLAVLADELVRLQVDLILAVNTPAAQVAKQATATIPIVFTRVGDPVQSGIVVSLAQPGGNVTGLSVLQIELSAKRIELLRAILPGLSRVAVLCNADNPGATLNAAEIERASAQLGLQQVRLLPVRGPSDFSGALQASVHARAEALVVIDDTTLTHHPLG